MKERHIAPGLDVDAFNCPDCGVFAKQSWFFMSGSELPNGMGIQHDEDRFKFSLCNHCHFPTIWCGEKIVFPLNSTAEPPDTEMPEEVRRDYEEARAILASSPRGAAALLRLGIQKLCIHLGKPGKKINDDIAELVKEGLPPKVQEALDSVRVIGNEAVHPGTMDLRDDRATANKLFKLVNFISQKLISEPKEVDEIYSGLPADKKEGISRRDSKGGKA